MRARAARHTRASAFAWLLVAASAASAACPPAGASLPRQRSSWPVLEPPLPRPPRCTGEGAARNCSKPWEEPAGEPPPYDRLFSSALARAAVASTWPDALRPLLRRLRSGAPLTLLGIGSSIVETHSGCYASREALALAGVAVTPPIMDRTLGRSPTDHCASSGFAADFLAAVNATWPHPHHLYLNNGRGGAGLDAFADYMCLDPSFPTVPVDVLLLESRNVDVFPTNSAAELVRHVEKIFDTVRRKVPLAADGAAPVVVVLHTFPLGDTQENAKRIERCVGGFGQHCASCGAENVTAMQERLGRAFANTASSPDLMAAAARRYGWSTLSLRDAMHAGLRDGAHSALGWSACEWLNAFYKDRVHPSKQGARLMADALLQLLLQAQDAEDAACGDAADAAAVGMAGADVSAVLLPPMQLPRFAPVAPGAFAAPLRLCNDVRHMEVRLSDGWEFTETEVVRNKTVHKRGWIGRTPGAALEFVVATRFKDVPPALNATLVVSFLTSYEHMGAAALTCVVGCACDGAALQGHVAERVSVEHSVALNVTQARECVLRLDVLPDTLSGEHKVKLITVTANAPPEPLPPPTGPPGYERR